MAEVQCLRMLSPCSSFILSFTAWYETTNHLWLVLEHCVGGDLRALLKHDAPLPERTVSQLAYGLCSAVATSHAHGVVHCDLRPGNVLLDEAGEIRLCGFGMCKHSNCNSTAGKSQRAHHSSSDVSTKTLDEVNSVPSSATAQDHSVTERGPVSGSPSYMAPELFENDGVYSTASDLYALGVLLFECAIGSPPFRSSSLQALVHSILHDDLPHLSESLSSEMSDFLSRLLSKDISARLSWPSLCAHTFWLGSRRPEEPVLPEEPDVRALIARRRHHQLSQPLNSNEHSANTDPTSRASNVDLQGDQPTENGQCNSFASKLPTQTGLHGSVDVTRISQLVHNTDDEETEHGEGPHAAAPVPTEDRSASSAALYSQKRQPGHCTHDGKAEPDYYEQVSTQSHTNGQNTPSSSELMNAETPKARRSVAEPNLQHENTTTLKDRSAGIQRRAKSAPSSNRRHGAAHSKDRASIQARNEKSAGVKELQYPTLIHKSDLIIKPIANSRRIETPLDSGFDAKRLPVDALSSQQMLSLPHSKLEEFMSAICHYVAGQSPPSDKLNLLAYFETLCCDQKAANLLINTDSLMSLFLKQVRSSPTASLRTRTLSILATLSRHASSIGDAILGDTATYSTNALTVMFECAKDKHPPARRKAVACLGELAFFAISQTEVESSGTDTSIHAPDNLNKALSVIVRIAKSGEDQVCQHYAIKALENILTCESIHSEELATLELASSLLTVSESGAKPEQLRRTAVSTVLRACRRNSNLMLHLLDKSGAQSIISLVYDNSTRVQQSGLTLLCLALANANARFKATIRSGKLGDGLANALVRISESSVPVLSAKAIRAISLLYCVSPERFTEAFVPRLVSNTERLARSDHDEYTVQCIEALKNAAADCASEQLDSLVKQQRIQSSSPRDKFSPLLLVIASDIFNGTFFSRGESVIASLGEALVRLRGKDIGLALLEASVQASEPLLERKAELLSSFVPQLCQCLSSPSGKDERFLALKLLCDCLLPLLVKESSALTRNDTGYEIMHLRSAISEGLIPACGTLLQDDDPTPLFALKLLAGAIEQDPTLLKEAVLHELETSFFAFLHLENENNNVHNLRICVHVVQSGYISNERLLSLDAPCKLRNVLWYAYRNSVETFLRYALDACAQLLQRDKYEDSERKFARYLATITPVCVELAVAPDESLARQSLFCVDMLLEYAGEEAVASNLFFNDDNGSVQLPLLLQSAESESFEGAIDSVCSVIERCAFTTAAAQASAALWHELSVAVNSLETHLPQNAGVSRLAAALNSFKNEPRNERVS